MTNRVKIILAVISAVVAVAVALIQSPYPWSSRKGEAPAERTPAELTSAELTITGIVVDKNDNSAVPQAQITLAGRPQRYVSDDSGNFIIRFRSNEGETANVRLRAEKVGYRVLDIGITPPIDGLILQMEKR